VTGNLTIALLIGVLYTMGTYLLLQRTLTRVVIGSACSPRRQPAAAAGAAAAPAACPFVGEPGGPPGRRGHGRPAARRPWC
jgi:hypothetical protein